MLSKIKQAFYYLLSWHVEGSAWAVGVIIAAFTVLGIVWGCKLQALTHICPAAQVVTKAIPVQGEVKTETKTEVVYVPKTVYIEKDGTKVQERTDIEANIGKTEIEVKVNGYSETIKKTDSEKYMFDENKLQLNQTSKATVDIKVPTVDKTRQWSAGIGQSSKGGTAYMIKAPIGHVVGAWGYHDDDSNAVGIAVNF